MSVFGESLATLLDSIGWSRYRLFKASGVSQQQISTIIHGRRPTDDVIQKFAQANAPGLTEQRMFAWRAADDYPDLVDGLSAQDAATQPPGLTPDQILELFFSWPESKQKQFLHAVAKKRGVRFE